MDKKLLHILIADIARDAIEIHKINKSDLLSYNKKIDNLAEDIFKHAEILHDNFFENWQGDENE